LRRVARRCLKGGILILYGVSSSSYLEGRFCPLARFGHNRDGTRGKTQINCVLCAADGCLVAVDVFAGNVADPTTVVAKMNTIRTRFDIDRIAFVGDRGIITTACIRAHLEPVSLDRISALTPRGGHPQIVAPRCR